MIMDKKVIKKILYVYISLSLIMFIYTIGELLSKHTRLKYGVDELSLLGKDPYYILRLQVAGMIDYIYIVSIYILVGIIIGAYILTKLRKGR